MNALLSYQFDESPVRVVMIAGDPWFIANDVARVLGYSATSAMTRTLDDDEKGVHIAHTLGGEQEHSLISESGLYAAVLKSRREEARRFRKWVTGEVLPSLRRTGQYQLHDIEPPPAIPADYDPPRLMASVAVVREARRLFGPGAARTIWSQLGLPEAISEALGEHNGDPFAEPLKDYLADKQETTSRDAARGIGLTGEPDFATIRRITVLLTMMGWTRRTVRRGKMVKIWERPQPLRAVQS